MKLDHTLQLDIERVPWDTLEHAYGGATDAPAALRALASDDAEQRGAAHDFLFFSVYHQGTVYSATVEVVPLLVRMLAAADFPDKHTLLQALNSMYHGSSYHEAHRSFTLLLGDTSTPEYQAKVDKELVWVNEVKRRVRAGLPTYLPLLIAPEWLTRLFTPVLLLSLSDDYDAIRPAAVAAFDAETHPLCRASLLLLAAVTGELIRPRWDALKADPSEMLRVVAAACLVRQEREATPPEAVDLLMQAMTAPGAELAEEYAQVPTHGNLAADAGAALSFAGPVAIERVTRNLLDDLQKGPDVNMQRTNLLLQLTCILANKLPFTDPAALSPLEVRVARECRRQLGLDMGSDGFKMSGFVNFLDLLRGFRLPDREDAFDAYLAQTPR